MIVANGFEKSFGKKSEKHASWYRELQKKVQVTPAINDAMLRIGNVGGMHGPRVGHAMQNIYLQGVYSAV